ncbi:(Fe-S)-binding protein [Halothiobacillus neapolitanus]|uniref:Glycolate oxidase iron-sulfur subunit n=1 Tax=Halothiobacillus neapolitanus (strain ATCC 23641 / DSM 15147 / CIP 104769 / NCIMB 8539 / c2) TaxID=555778 RepID=D0KVN6_HALNC|nr:(Fe-S)-binding protein [Halothiobacillus neapolitanus]ACX96866.1 4Fe-4S ferredoxin iron-sulfur binding domain protein [Halothiobacillus neapolitanus c2]TDN65024.1 glycolate oxidase iron-sulfur subunit [Halothiobacillus neapolitanus]
MDTPTHSTNRSPVKMRIKHHALDCVMCGICVPHCPTFALSQNEADGPRGRISLALGLAGGTLALDAGVVAHLDGCLTCRACESVCPSLVRYGGLIDEVRDALAHDEFEPAAANARPRAASRRWIWLRHYVLSQRQVFGAIWTALFLLERLKLAPMMRRFGGRMGQILPPALPRRFRPSAIKSPSPAPEAATKTVGLFIGCTGEALNSDAVRASIKVLSALGYTVEIPTAQVCCGAMHQHGGDIFEATRLRAANRTAFTNGNLSAIVAIGTACAGELQREPSDVPFMEITDFLAQVPADRWPQLQPIPARAAIHLPCSQTRVLKQPHSTEQLLERIPALNRVPLATNDRCCGAAGMHVLMYPDQADALRAPKLEEVKHLKPDFVVSANIGCATHIAVGLGTAVLHPVELIANSIG